MTGWGRHTEEVHRIIVQRPGVTVRDIAALVCRHPSIIERELPGTERFVPLVYEDDDGRLFPFYPAVEE